MHDDSGGDCSTRLVTRLRIITLFRLRIVCSAKCWMESCLPCTMIPVAIDTYRRAVYTNAILAIDINYGPLWKVCHYIMCPCPI